MIHDLKDERVMSLVTGLKRVPPAIRIGVGFSGCTGRMDSLDCKGNGDSVNKRGNVDFPDAMSQSVCK